MFNTCQNDIISDLKPDSAQHRSILNESKYIFLKYLSCTQHMVAGCTMPLFHEEWKDKC